VDWIDTQSIYKFKKVASQNFDIFPEKSIFADFFLLLVRACIMQATHSITALVLCEIGVRYDSTLAAYHVLAHTERRERVISNTSYMMTGGGSGRGGRGRVAPPQQHKRKKENNNNRFYYDII